MAIQQRDHSLGSGVYFAPEHYLGFGPRVIIFIVDAVALGTLMWVVAFAWLNMFGDYDELFLIAAGAMIWLYVVWLKRTEFRTIGYRLVNAKLVTLRGKRPSLLMLTFRSLLWIFGPFSFALDFIWCSIDEDKQTMRDRFTNMCLVRNDAQPIGSGEVHLTYLNAFGYSLQYPRVVKPKVSG